MAKEKQRGIRSLRDRLTQEKEDITQDTPIRMKDRPYQTTVREKFKLYNFILICWCRRLGKDMFALSEAARQCIEVPGSVVYYVFNTMKQGKMMILDGRTEDKKRILEEVINVRYIKKSRNGELYHTDNTIRFKNGSIIYFVDSKDADTKVGGHLDLLVLSEWATYKNQNFIDYLVPSTIKVGGKILAVSTPRFGSEFNNMVNSPPDNVYVSKIGARDQEAKDNDGAFVYTDDQLEYAKSIMSYEKFLQEYYCNTNVANEESIYAKSLELLKWREKTPKNYRQAKIEISLDLGINDGCSMVFTVNEYGKVPYIDHWEFSNNQPTKYYIDLVRKYMDQHHIHPANVKIILPHDANNRIDGFTNIYTRERFWKQEGFETVVIPAQPVDTGIEVLRTAIQQHWIEFDDNPVINNMISRLKEYQWQVKDGVIQYVPAHGKGLSASNIADSLEYETLFKFRNKYIDDNKNFVPRRNESKSIFG